MPRGCGQIRIGLFQAILSPGFRPNIAQTSVRGSIAFWTDLQRGCSESALAMAFFTFFSARGPVMLP